MTPGLDEEPDLYRIAVTAEVSNTEDLANLRALYGESGALLASRSAALDMYYFVLRMRLEGFAVAVNPRLQYHAPPNPTLAESEATSFTMRPEPSGCKLNDSVPCVWDAFDVWAFNAVWDFDGQEIPSAVLDMGFATNADFRAPSAGAMVECDMTVIPANCGPGTAQGPPTVGGSLVGDLSWHGTGVVTTLGGVVNNGFGAAGVGGQVVVPMLYKYNLAAYAFDLGAGIRRAVDDGAANINISAGFPCNILTNIGPSFDICSPEGRLGICAIVTAGAHTAPTGSAYFAPTDVNDPSSPLGRDTISGTSGAAPYVTGLVANIQAIDPELNPNNSRLSDAQHARIVPRIRQLITDDANSFSNAELVAMGHASQPARREIVNPRRVMEAAAAGHVPDLAALGYDQTFGFSEFADPNDTRTSADPLPFGTTVTGTIVDLHAEPGVPQTVDRDWYTFTMPLAANSARFYQSTVSVEYPSSDDPIAVVTGDNYILTSRGSRTEYSFLGQSNRSIEFALGGFFGGDNVYKVRAETPTLVNPIVEIVQPASSSTLCDDETILFQASIEYPSPFQHRTVSIPDTQIQWRDRTSGAILGTGPSINVPLSIGSHRIEVRLYGDSSLSDTFIASVTDCTGLPPNSVEIVLPVFPVACGINEYHTDGFDAARGQRYTDVTLRGTATDPEDGRLRGASLVWRTNRTEVQPAVLGTGENLSVRLYTTDQFGANHQISLSATDSDGNVTTMTTEICIWTLI